MTIPKDIEQTAARVFDKLGRGSLTDEQTIALAILAERNRCANRVLAARMGEADTDLRSIHHVIMNPF